MYKAFVAKIDRISPIEGAEKIALAIVKNTPVIISKETQVGDIVLFFPSEGQLSPDFCHHNNLFRDASLNSDKEKTGYFEDSRRVRTQKFMKVKSDGFVCPLSFLNYLLKDGDNLDFLVEGYTFSEILGVNVCRKYQKFEKTPRGNRGSQKSKKATYEEFLVHEDTEQLAFYISTIPVGALVTISHKMHGTSGRYGIHRPSPTKLDNLLARFGLFRKVTHPLVGTRRVTYSEVTTADSQDHPWIQKVKSFFGIKPKTSISGFHGVEDFRVEVMKELSHVLEEGMTIYGEIVGYDSSGKPIMANHSTNSLRDKKYLSKYGETISYKYGCLPGQFKFFVYRASYVTRNGEVIDLTPFQLRRFCEMYNLKYVAELHPPFIYNGNSEQLLQLVESLAERSPEYLTEDYVDPSHVNEGVVVRVDYNDTKPSFFKYKTFAFKVMEGIAKDIEPDIEDNA